MNLEDSGVNHNEGGEEMIKENELWKKSKFDLHDFRDTSFKSCTGLWIQKIKKKIKKARKEAETTKPEGKIL